MTEIETEIERKFLVADLPRDLESFPHEEIEQGYIEITAESETRVRRKGQKFFYGLKVGTGAVREAPPEREISEEEFNQLWPNTQGKRISKTRYLIGYQSYILEIDIYHGNLQGLVIAEVEFQSEEEMAQFTPPSWFGQEVTLDKAYKNQTLATQGLPRSTPPRR